MLHAEQDSYSHDGFTVTFGHLWTHSYDKTYNAPGKADAMAEDTYQALQQAGISIGMEAGAVPYAELLPFVQGFNRAKKKKDKDAQLDLLRQHVDQYRRDHKDDKKKQGPPLNSGVCSAEFSQC